MTREDLTTGANLEGESKGVVIEIPSFKKKFREVLVERERHKNPDSLVTRWTNSLLYFLSIVADDEQKKEIKSKSSLKTGYNDVELSPKSIELILGWKESPVTPLSRKIEDKDLRLIQETLRIIMIEASPFKSAEELASYALENQKDGNDPIQAAITHISGDIYKSAVGLELQTAAIKLLKAKKLKENSG